MPTLAPLLHTDYLDRGLCPKQQRSTVRNLVKHLKPLTKKFDAIAFRGVSGALFAPIVAYQLHKSLIVVRKGERAHTPRRVEGREVPRHIILDDAIDTGATLNCMLSDIRAAMPTTKLKGVIFYNYPVTNEYELQYMADMLGAWVISEKIDFNNPVNDMGYLNTEWKKWTPNPNIIPTGRLPVPFWTAAQNSQLIR